MKPISRIHIAALALFLTVMLCACGVSVEQPPGTKVAATAALSGKWNTRIEFEGAKPGILSVEPSGDELLVHWESKADEGASARAAMFEYRGRRYMALTHGPHANGYFMLRIEDISVDQIRAHALDGARAEQLLTLLNLPVVYRELWLQKELFLDKASFAQLMDRHADALFDKGVAVTLTKIR